MSLNVNSLGDEPVVDGHYRDLRLLKLGEQEGRGRFSSKDGVIIALLFFGKLQITFSN